MHAARWFAGPFLLLATCASPPESPSSASGPADAVQSVARAADEHQWGPLARAFAPVVVLDYGTPEHLSPSEIVARWQPLLSAFDRTEHHVTIDAITLGPGAARVKSHFSAVHVLDGRTWVLDGRYEHDLAKSAHGWQITGMKMIPVAEHGDTGVMSRAREAAQRAARTTR